MHDLAGSAGTPGTGPADPARQDECLRLLYARHAEAPLPDELRRLAAGLAGLRRRERRRARCRRLAAAATGVLLLAGLAVVGSHHGQGDGTGGEPLVPRSRADALVHGAAPAVGVDLHPPDLAAAGYTLVGSRVLAGAVPAVQFGYADASGGRIWLYISAAERAAAPAVMAEAGPLSVVAWRDAALAYSLVAEAGPAVALEIAASLHDGAAISPDAAEAAAGGEVREAGGREDVDAEAPPPSVPDSDVEPAVDAPSET